MIGRIDPERLLKASGSEVERRLIRAIACERPSSDLRRRMACAIGVTPGISGPSANTMKATPSAAKAAGASSGWGWSFLPWISAGVLSMALASVIVSASIRRPGAPSEISTPNNVPVVVPPAGAPAQAVPSPLKQASSGPPSSQRQGRTRMATNDLRGQIALIDAARSALVASAMKRALEQADQYQDRYPGGTFIPEAAAIKIKALAGLGRMSEARTLAQRFRSRYGPGPQTDQVLRAVGMTAP